MQIGDIETVIEPEEDGESTGNEAETVGRERANSTASRSDSVSINQHSMEGTPSMPMGETVVVWGLT